MFNEGVHLPDMDGVILLRPTSSPVIFKQQIGRAISSTGKKNPVIFDLVMNLTNLHSIDAIEDEVYEALAAARDTDPKAKDEIIDRFQVIDETKEITDLIVRLNRVLGATWTVMYNEAKEYYRIHKNLNIPRRYVTPEGYALGSWISIQRRVRGGTLSGILTENQIRKLDTIGMNWEYKHNTNFNDKFELAKRYYEKNGNLDITARYKTYEGIPLGKWITRLRRLRKNGSASLTEEMIRKLDSIGMIWNYAVYRWDAYIGAAEKYAKEHGNLNVPAKYCTEDGTSLGGWIQQLRLTVNYPQLHYAEISEEKISQLNALGMDWAGCFKTNWEMGISELEKYRKENGPGKIPLAYVSESGFKLGKWISHKKDRYKMMPDDETRKKKLIELGITF